MHQYQAELVNEFERISRAEDAGAVLADLRITHCPACDQSVSGKTVDQDDCFLCHQHLPDELTIEALGTVRLRFERERLSGEIKEAGELLTVFKKDLSKWTKEVTDSEETLRSIERELAPARKALAGLVQEEISAIDVALGQASERERQIRRLVGALEVGSDLDRQIESLEKEIAPIQQEVSAKLSATDFDAGASFLEDGMNDYLNALNLQRPGLWRHSSVNVDLSRSSFALRVGRRRWQSALGGTDALYFLMSYHYGLLSLSDKSSCRYPGVAIIDLPGEFSGEAVEDKENFIVKPFVDLLSRKEYEGTQLIMTGASFVGLDGAHFQHLTDVYTA